MSTPIAISQVTKSSQPGWLIDALKLIGNGSWHCPFSLSLERQLGTSLSIYSHAYCLVDGDCCRNGELGVTPRGLQDKMRVHVREYNVHLSPKLSPPKYKNAISIRNRSVLRLLLNILTSKAALCSHNFPYMFSYSPKCPLTQSFLLSMMLLQGHHNNH